MYFFDFDNTIDILKMKGSLLVIIRYFQKLRIWQSWGRWKMKLSAQPAECSEHGFLPLYSDEPLTHVKYNWYFTQRKYLFISLWTAASLLRSRWIYFYLFLFFILFKKILYWTWAHKNRDRRQESISDKSWFFIATIVTSVIGNNVTICNNVTSTLIKCIRADAFAVDLQRKNKFCGYSLVELLEVVK